MLTTGFKTFAGWAIALAIGAVVFGYTTGGDSVGPVSMGWKGGVGNHVGYAILLGGAAICAVLAGVLVAFRDADADAAASYLHVADVPVGQRPTQPSYWPVIGAFGAAMVLVGLVASEILFVAGVVVVALTAIEWTMTAWADAATGDPETNKALRDRVMGPIEIPVLGFGAIAVFVLAFSRIFISVSAEAAVWVAIGIAAVIFGVAILFALRPNISRNVVVAACLLGGVGVLAAGVVAGAVGERDFEHEEEHGAEEEHGDEGAEEGAEEGTEGDGGGADAEAEVTE
ncbi:MAG: hypothetical protein OES57_11895 [Acidimicrobiia bacterium]|nr:hypothetical protein [Acidimicrobiia bacterium]